jgi:ubiquitin-like 1-activating enzyme E1 B
VSTNGIKRKREAEDADLEDGPVSAKRFAAISDANGDGSHPIVLDESESGAILIDDD